MSTAKYRPGFKKGTYFRLEFTDLVNGVKVGTIGQIMARPFKDPTYPRRTLVPVYWLGYNSTAVEDYCLVALTPSQAKQQAAENGQPGYTTPALTQGSR